MSSGAEFFTFACGFISGILFKKMYTQIPRYFELNKAYRKGSEMGYKVGMMQAKDVQHQFALAPDRDGIYCTSCMYFQDYKKDEA